MYKFADTDKFAEQYDVIIFLSSPSQY